MADDKKIEVTPAPAPAPEKPKGLDHKATALAAAAALLKGDAAGGGALAEKLYVERTDGFTRSVRRLIDGAAKEDIGKDGTSPSLRAAAEMLTLTAQSMG